MRRRRRIALAAVSMAGWAIAAAPAHGASTQKLPLIDTSDADRCDFIAKPNRGLCLLPFPNDYYTVRDAEHATGRRVNLKTAAMPANVDGKHIDARPVQPERRLQPGPADRPQGSRPEQRGGHGSDRRGADQRHRPLPGSRSSRSSSSTPRPGSGGRSGPRSTPTPPSPAAVALEIHPARNLVPHHRYIVALRNLKTAGGQTIQAPAAFRYYRDRIPSDQQAINRRRARTSRSIFQTLRQGRDRRGRTSTWHGTSRSPATRTSPRACSAFATTPSPSSATRTSRIGSSRDARRRSTSASVTNFTPSQNARIAREVKGTFTVPCYLAPNCAPGGRFQLDASGLPTRHGDWTANFDCIIPRSAVQGRPPRRARRCTGTGCSAAPAR